MKLIAAVDKNWGIGYQGNLLARISEDQKHFRNLTTGNVVVLGRKTLSGFPGGRPLKNRTNIILTRQPDFSAGDALIAHSLEELTETLKSFDPDRIFICGGASLYVQLLDYCHEAVITKIDQTYPADAYFPDLDRNPAWQLSSESEIKNDGDLQFRFCYYRNEHPTLL